MATMGERKNFSSLLLSLYLCLLLIGNLQASVFQFNKDTVVRSERSSSPEAKLRTKRDSGDARDQKCQHQDQDLHQKITQSPDFISKFKFENETKYSLALAWAGENTGKIIVVATDEIGGMFAQPSNVYYSENDGKQFANINSRLNGKPYIHKNNGLQKHPLNSLKLYLVAYADDGLSDLWITDNGGQTFERSQLPFSLDDSIEFHPNKGYTNNMLALDRDHKALYLSEDGGKGWRKIHEKVKHFKWSTHPDDPAGSIYITVDSNEESGFISIFSSWAGVEHTKEMMKTTDMGATWTKILQDVYMFGLQDKFLYASVANGDSEDERLMKISTDGGQVWNEAKLPTITSDRFYSIMDTSEGMVFMHVDAEKDSGYGTLYTSDSSGIIFSESLDRHLYPNYEDLTDFYRVESMRGVYIASQLEEDKSIHTMITYDRGGEWHAIERPHHEPCLDEAKGCYLQIHNMYSINHAYRAQPPLSISNGHGIIITHGHIADTLQTTPPDVFISNDGGYNWFKALSGPHSYQIADHGGLIVAVKSEVNPDTIKFSTDEGQCWYEVKFTNESFVMTGLLTEPGNAAMSVAIYGFGADDHEWQAHVVDFSKIIDRQCTQDSDYEPFTPHSLNGKSGCLLGTRETIMKLKKDSLCKNGHSYEPKQDSTVCECTKADYECDYGYHRPADSEACVKDPDFIGTEIDICLGNEEEEIVTVGYRLIPGDKCEGGFSPAGEKIIDLKKKCNEGDKSIEKQEFADLEQASWTDRIPKPSNSGIILLSVITSILLVLVIMLAFFIRKCYQLRYMNASYRYSLLTTAEAGDQEIERALGTHTSLYEESDDEDTSGSRSTGNAHTPLQANGSAPLANGSAGTGYNSTTSRSPARSPAKPSPRREPARPPVKSYHDDSDVDMLE